MRILLWRPRWIRGGGFDHVEKAFPKAVESGIFKRGNIPNLPIAYDLSDAEKMLGRKLKGFSSAITDVAE